MIIGLGYFSPFLLLPFIAPLFACLRSFVVYKLNENGFTSHPFILTFLMLLGEFIGGSLQIILYCRQKDSRIAIHKANYFLTVQQFDQENSNPVHLWSYKQYLSLLGFSLLDLTAMTLLNVVSFKNNQLNNLEFQMKGVQMIIDGLFGLRILHYPIFRHHLLSMVLIVVGMLLITFDTFLSVNDLSVLLKIVIILVSLTMWAFQEVSQKYLMEYKFVSPFQVLLFEGMYGMTVCIILIAAFNNITCPDSFGFCEVGKNIENISEAIQFINSKPILILYLCLYCLTSSIYNILIVVIEKKYSPTHKSVGDTIDSFFWECILYSLGLMIFDSYKIVHLIGYVLMIIATLLYNEILICYLCKLEVNTKKEIAKRAIEDNVISQETPTLNVELNDVLLII